jgi:hypothetical protein
LPKLRVLVIDDARRNLYVKLLGSDFKIPNTKKHAAHSCPDRLGRTDKLQYNKALASGEKVREGEAEAGKQRRHQGFAHCQSAIRQRVRRSGHLDQLPFVELVALVSSNG